MRADELFSYLKKERAVEEPMTLRNPEMERIARDLEATFAPPKKNI